MSKFFKFLFLLILFLFVSSDVGATYVTNAANTNENLKENFLNTAKEYSKEIFPELEDEEILDKIIKGELFKRRKFSSKNFWCIYF